MGAVIVVIRLDYIQVLWGSIREENVSDASVFNLQFAVLVYFIYHKGISWKKFAFFKKHFYVIFFHV